jgi:hypothetical protein
LELFRVSGDAIGDGDNSGLGLSESVGEACGLNEAIADVEGNKVAEMLGASDGDADGLDDGKREPPGLNDADGLEEGVSDGDPLGMLNTIAVPIQKKKKSNRKKANQLHFFPHEKKKNCHHSRSWIICPKVFRLSLQYRSESRSWFRWM